MVFVVCYLFFTRLICAMSDGSDKIYPASLPGQNNEAVSLIDAREIKAEGMYKNAVESVELGKLTTAAVTLKEIMRDFSDTSFVNGKLHEIINIHSNLLPKVIIQMINEPVQTVMLTDPFKGFEMAFPIGWTAIPVVQVKPGMFVTNSQNLPDELQGLRFVVISPFSNDITISIYLNDGMEDVEAISDFYMEKLCIGKKKSLQEIRINGKVFQVANNNSAKKFYFYSDVEFKRGFCFSIGWKRDATYHYGNDKIMTSIELLMSSILSTFKTSKPVKEPAKGSIDVVQISPEHLPGWNIHETTHFKFLYTTDNKFVETLGLNLEVMWKLYEKVLSDGRNIINNQQSLKGTIRLFDDSFQRDIFVKAPQGVGAFYISQTKQVVACRERGRYVGSGKQVAVPSEVKEATFNLLYHEVFHLYADLDFISSKKDYRFPPWINEGLGEYFFGAVIDEESKKIAGISKNFFRYPVVCDLINSNKFVPFNEFLYYTRKQYYSSAGISYAQGWSICYFILENKGESGGEYRKFLGLFLNKLRDRADWKKCLDESLRETQIDLATMEKDWKSYFLDQCRQSCKSGKTDNN